MVLLGVTLIIVPTAVLMSSLGDSVHQLIIDVQEDTLQIPAPPDAVATWPLVGEKLYATWSAAYTDLPALIKSMQPKIGDLTKTALGFVASIGGGLLQFLGAFIIAGIIMAFGGRAAVQAFPSSSASPAPRGAPSSRSSPRRPYGPLPKASSASPSFRQSSSAFVCSLPVCRGRAYWR